MNTHLELMQEIIDAVTNVTAERRAEIADRISELFVLESSRYSDEEVSLFDDVFSYLVSVLENSAREALAKRLATNAEAPPTVCRTLASDDEIDVAAPILEYSVRLDSTTLVNIARTKSQRHLLAISKRKKIDEEVTDVLATRGDRLIVLTAVQNSGARFSEFGYATLLDRSKFDDELTTTVGLRCDLPRHHFLKLLARASFVVRNKLEAADPLGSEAIRKTVAEAASMVQLKTAMQSKDYISAGEHVNTLFPSKQITESDVRSFANASRFEETVIVLAVLCKLPIDQIESALVANRPEPLLILAKASGLSWNTVKPILTMRRATSQEIERCLGTFSRLKASTARQIIEFQRSRSGADVPF